MSAVLWEEPPPMGRHGRKPGHVAEFVEQLKANPGRWARFPDGTKSATAGGTYTARYPGTKWTTRKLEDGTIGLWAKWIEEDA